MMDHQESEDLDFEKARELNNTMTDSTSFEKLDQEVSYRFEWKLGGTNVLLFGDFNNWQGEKMHKYSKKLKMRKDPNNSDLPTHFLEKTL